MEENIHTQESRATDIMFCECNENQCSVKYEIL